MSAPDVLVIGDANPDLLLTGDVVPRFGQAERLVESADLVLGGSAAIVACGLSRLGVATALAATVGDDLYGEFVRDALTERGVDVRWLRTHPSAPTGLSVVLSVGDRAILTHPGTIASTGPEVVDEDLVARVRHVHSASCFLTPRLAAHLPRLLATARDGGATTSVDTNWDPAERWDGVLPLLEQADVLMPNATELRALTGRPDLDEAARVVLDRGCRVALKNGAEGGALWEAPDVVRRVPAPAVPAVDTTGAGDSFDAGFISGMMDGLSGEECLVRAVRCGSLSTRGVGGTAAQPTLAEVRDQFRAAPAG
jgi:sugar/nucleoside kinase (ribokinase family)